MQNRLQFRAGIEGLGRTWTVKVVRSMDTIGCSTNENVTKGNVKVRMRSSMVVAWCHGRGI